MPVDTFSEFVADQLAGLDGLVIKKMFGGSGLYLNKKFFRILLSAKLYFNPRTGLLQRYLAEPSKTFVYSKKEEKPVRLKDYYEVPVGILENQKALKSWALEASEV